MLTPRVVSNEKATKYLQCQMGVGAAYAVAEPWCSWGFLAYHAHDDTS